MKTQREITRLNYEMAYRIARQLHTNRENLLPVYDDSTWRVIESAVHGLCLTHVGYMAWLSRIDRDTDRTWCNNRARMAFQFSMQWGKQHFLAQRALELFHAKYG